MRMRFGSLVLACAVLGPAVAKADIFTITGQGQNISWYLPDSPTPDVYETGVGFLFNNVAVTDNGTTTTAEVAFGASEPVVLVGLAETLAGGVLEGGNPSWGTYTGPSLYTGSESNPTFSLVSDAAVTNIEPVPTEGVQPGAYTLTIAAGGPPTATGVTPEPASLLLLGTGLLGTIGAVRRRSI